MKRWILFFVLLSFAFLSGCGGDDDGKIITLESDDVESVSSATPDECDDDCTASSSSEVSSSSVSSSSKVSSSSYGGIGKSKIIHGFAQKGTPVDQAEVRVVFLDVFPKRGPLQQLNIDDKEILRLIEEFNSEASNGLLKEYEF